MFFTELSERVDPSMNIWGEDVTRIEMLKSKDIIILNIRFCKALTTFSGRRSRITCRHDHRQKGCNWQVKRYRSSVQTWMAA